MHEGRAGGGAAGSCTPCGAAFAGRWRDEEGTVVTIEGTTLRGPGGALEVLQEDHDSCSVRAGGEVHRAQAVAGGSLVWSDGSVWQRVEDGMPGGGTSTCPAEVAGAARSGCERAAPRAGPSTDARAACAGGVVRAKKSDQVGHDQLQALPESTRLVLLDELLQKYKDGAFQQKLHEAWRLAKGNKVREERARKTLCWKVYTPVLKQHKLSSACLDLLQSCALSAAGHAEGQLGHAIQWYLDPGLQAAGPLREDAKAAQPRSSREPAARGGRRGPAGPPATVLVRLLGGLSGELLCEHQAACSDRVRDVKEHVSRRAGIPVEQQRLLLGQRLLHGFEAIGDVAGELRDRQAHAPEAGSGRPASEPLDILVVRLDPERASLLDCLERGQAELQELADEYRDDAEAVLAAARWSAGALGLASERLRGQREFLLAAVGEHPCALQHASRALRGDPSLALAAVRQDGTALRFAGQQPRSDPEVVLAAVANDGAALQFASWELRAQEDVVLAAVRSSGAALQFADVTVVGDAGIVAAAIRQDREAVRFAAEDLTTDPSFWPTMEEAGLFDDPKMEDLLWISPKDAADLGRRAAAIFADARFSPAFRLGHVAGAFSLPGGRSTHELGDVEETEVFPLLLRRRDCTLVVYSDDGADLAFCLYLARRFRMHPRIKAHRVLRLRGGLKLWQESGFPVEGSS